MKDTDINQSNTFSIDNSSNIEDIRINEMMKKFSPTVDKTCAMNTLKSIRHPNKMYKTVKNTYTKNNIQNNLIKKCGMTPLQAEKIYNNRVCIMKILQQ